MRRFIDIHLFINLVIAISFKWVTFLFRFYRPLIFVLFEYVGVLLLLLISPCKCLCKLESLKYQSSKLWLAFLNGCMIFKVSQDNFVKNRR